MNQSRHVCLRARRHRKELDPDLYYLGGFPHETPLSPITLCLCRGCRRHVRRERASAADPLQLPGVVDAVTVYRGQALVTRVVDVPGPAGLREIVVTNLPDQVEPGSIYAEAADGAEVRSVSYSVRPVEKDVRDEVQKLDDQIRTVQDKLNAAQRHRQALDAQKEYMTRLEQFTAGTSTVELTKGVLNADTLQKITQFPV